LKLIIHHYKIRLLLLNRLLLLHLWCIIWLLLSIHW